MYINIYVNMYINMYGAIKTNKIDNALIYIITPK